MNPVKVQIDKKSRVKIQFLKTHNQRATAKVYISYLITEQSEVPQSL